MIEPYPKNPAAKFGAILLLIFAFLAIYQPWRLGERELNAGEGFLAAQTLEMDLSMPMAAAHGAMLGKTYPLFPYFAAWITHATGGEMEETLRLLTIGFLLLTATLVFIGAGSAGSFKAGAVAAAMYFSSAIVMEKSVFCSPATLTALLVLGAQLVWFYCGVRYGRWNLAWILSLFLIGLGFSAGGPSVFFYFALPLLFMHRPLSIGPKLAKWGLAVGLAMIVGIAVAYSLPYQFMSRGTPLLVNNPNYPGWSDYFWHLLGFPFSFLLRMLPWTLIFWAPYCSALAVQDETPIFSRYLRTLSTVLFVIAWLNPLTKAGDMIYIAGPLSILTGLWYEAAVRRYSRQIRQLLLLCVYAVVAAACCIFLFALLPEAWLGRFFDLHGVSVQSKPGFQAFVIGIGNAMLLLAVWMYLARKKRQVWLILLAGSVAGAIFFWTVLQPYRVGENERRKVGERLAAALHDDRAGTNATVYKMAMGGFYSEGYYFGRPLRAIDSVEDIAPNESRVYVVSEVFPQDPNRLWVNLLPKDFTYNGERLCLWRGDLIRNRKPLRRQERIQP